MSPLFRVLSVAFFAFTVPIRAQDQPVRPKGEVIEFGTFQLGTPQVTVPNGNTPGGAERNAPEARFTSKSDRIPAQLGVAFGFRFKLSNLPEKTSVDLKTVVKHPPIKNREGVVKSEFSLITTLAVTAGRVSEVTGYSLDRPEELVPGVWKFEHWYRDQKLVSQSFTIVAPDETSAKAATPPSLPVETNDISWIAQPKQDTALVINGIKIGFKEGDNYDELIARVTAACRQVNTVKVIVPPTQGQLELPPLGLPGFLYDIFDAFTFPNHEVIYFYQGRQLRRYQIRCSDKGTANDPERANYWIDGEFLGTWPQAKLHFEKMDWEEGAIADIHLDAHPMLSASGIGMFGVPQELGTIFMRHQITQNRHFRPRAENDK